jgi:hypothetical protein
MSSTLGMPRPEQASYVLRTVARDAGRAYRQQFLDLFDLQTGQI